MIFSCGGSIVYNFLKLFRLKIEPAIAIKQGIPSHPSGEQTPASK